METTFIKFKVDFVLANPPFNVSDYTLIQDDARWKYGIPPANNANYAWMSISLVAFSKGVAGFCSQTTMSTSTKAESEIRKNIIGNRVGGLYSNHANESIL